MELSKAPRLTPFTAWGGSCEGASVLAGGGGAAAGGGGGGGGGGNADILYRKFTFKMVHALLLWRAESARTGM